MSMTIFTTSKSNEKNSYKLIAASLIVYSSFSTGRVWEQTAHCHGCIFNILYNCMINKYLNFKFY